MKDPYIQENGTLKNKLGINDYDRLNLAEKDITFSKFLNIDNAFSSKFNIEYLKEINKYIFDDIFDWAGSFRTVPIYKEEVVIPMLSLNYAEPKNIVKELTKCLNKINSIKWESLSLDEKSKVFTECLAELWLIHPFRDGNTRTVLTFAKQFSMEHDFPMDLGSLLDNLSRKYDENGKITQFSIRDKFVLACIPKKFSPEPEHLTALIHKSIVNGTSKKIEDLSKNLSSDSGEER